MSTSQFPDFSPHIVNGAYEVASHHIGKTLVDTIRNCFPSGKIRRGNYYLGRSRYMLAQHYARLEHEDRCAIGHEFTNTMDAKEKLGRSNGSIFKKHSLAKEYKEVAKSLFIIVEIEILGISFREPWLTEACPLAYLLAYLLIFADLTQLQAAQPTPIGTTSSHSNPFSDSHEASSLPDVNVGNLNQVEMSIFESETAGDVAVVLGLHGQDGSTQEVAATIPLAVISGDMTKEGAIPSMAIWKLLEMWVIERSEQRVLPQRRLWHLPL
ncbi:hypothetical protein V8E53_014106 [Lactarius tabidus]